MNKRITAMIAAGALVATAFMMTGCYRVDLGEVSDTKIERVSLGSAQDVLVDLDMGAGDLTIGSGAKDLMEAEFSFSSDRFEPEVDYDVRGDTGILKVRQSAGRSLFGLSDYRNVWDIQLADDVPMELNIDMGAGKTDLALGDLMLTEMTLEAGAGDVLIDFAGSRYLTELKVEAGAGEVTIDLSGDGWTEDLDVRMTAGVGDITIIVPKDTGVRFNVDTGVGDVDARGFVSQGSDVYVNEAYDKADTVMDILVEAGVGQVTLEQR